MLFSSVLVPGEPQNVKARALNTTSINVTWTDPRNTNGIITKYVVHYREKEKETVKQKTVKNGLSQLLTSLVVYTKYYISVQAFTVAGGGKWSEPINETTASGGEWNCYKLQ